MTYQIRVSPVALKYLKSLSPSLKKRIDDKILALAKNPRPAGAKTLKGMKGLLRVRVGDYRIIYKVEYERLLILIIKIGHRGDVYRH